MNQETVITFTCEGINCQVKENFDDNEYFGYVQIPPSHPWHNKENKIEISIDTKISYNFFDGEEHWLGFEGQNNLSFTIKNCKAICLQLLYVTEGPYAIAKRMIGITNYLELKIVETISLYA